METELSIWEKHLENELMERDLMLAVEAGAVKVGKPNKKVKYPISNKSPRNLINRPNLYMLSDFES